MEKKMTTDQRLDALLEYLQVNVSVVGRERTGEPIISAGPIYLYSSAPGGVGQIVSGVEDHPWNKSSRAGRERHNLLLKHLGLEEYETIAKPSERKIRPLKTTKKGKK